MKNIGEKMSIFNKKQRKDVYSKSNASLHQKDHPRKRVTTDDAREALRRERNTSWEMHFRRELYNRVTTS